MKRTLNPQWNKRLTRRLLSLAALLFAGMFGGNSRAQLTQKTMPYQDGVRTWYEHVPSSYDGTHSVPLVIALHGFNGNGHEFALASEWMPESDDAGFIVAFPSGGGPIDQNFGWNAFVYDGKAPDDAGFLLTLIEKLKKDYRIDASRVYMTGFSNGGGMTSTFAELHGSVLAGIAPISGGWRASFGLRESVVKPDAPVPVWLWRGTGENFENGSLTLAQQDALQAQFWVETNGDKSPPQTYSDWPFTTAIYRGGQAEVRFTWIEGGAHENRPGTSKKIWEGFFSLFSREGKNIVYHAPKKR